MPVSISTVYCYSISSPKFTVNLEHAQDNTQVAQHINLYCTALVIFFSGTKLWEIIAEVVHMCMFPSPLNPFAVDRRYFDSLPLAERIIATGAMANFLQEILADGNHPYNARGTYVVQCKCTYYDVRLTNTNVSHNLSTLRDA